MHLRAICLDCGDTLADEGTEVKDESGTTLHAQLIPGAAELVPAIKAAGYKLALVADGPAGTFHNILGQHRLLPYFDALAISTEVGAEKPNRRIFDVALQALGVGQGDYGRALMMGNNLARDIAGANALGIISVWLDWAPRRAKVPASPAEEPRFTVKNPLELLEVIASLERAAAA